MHKREISQESGRTSEAQKIAFIIPGIGQIISQLFWKHSRKKRKEYTFYADIRSINRKNEIILKINEKNPIMKVLLSKPINY
jgi:hypothetical protein